MRKNEQLHARGRPELAREPASPSEEGQVRRGGTHICKAPGAGARGVAGAEVSEVLF